MVRSIVFYRNYFIVFYREQDAGVQVKIEYVLDLIRFEKRIPVKFFNYLEGNKGIYEIRVVTTFKNIRILCFFDQRNLIVLINSFIKKSKKTPRKEIKFAEHLKAEYLSERYGEKY